MRLLGQNKKGFPLWELEGERRLPPVLNKLVNEDGGSDVTTIRGCWVDDYYSPPVLRYSAKDLARAMGGSFDVATTHETWQSGLAELRPRFLICSRRFREWSMARKLPIEWIPVEIVEE